MRCTNREMQDSLCWGTDTGSGGYTHKFFRVAKSADDLRQQRDAIAEIMARHFAGMTGVTMEERFAFSGWQQGALGQPVLKGSLASLEGEISQVQTIGTHLVYLVEIRNITLSPQGHGLIYFKRRFHPVMMEMEVAV
ncbi:4-hydroxyphenylacetate 3-monooxygenase [Klebsiella pneumoniae]|nr:4-hydroxyphenylacetate 3-monooxygenase [Klebsiella pneumoniae]